jgi:GNAT superfamily N-acetyltransferase
MTSLVTDVRPARRSDAGALADVYAAAWREAYAGIIPALVLERMIVRRAAPWWREVMGRRAILVLEVGGAIAGYASFAPMSRGPGGRAHPGAAEIQEIYLAPEYQGIGLGIRLFAAALKRIKGRGYPRVLVRALAENHRAHGFYLRHGGRVVARSEEVLGDRKLPCLWYEFRA